MFVQLATNLPRGTALRERSNIRIRCSMALTAWKSRGATATRFGHEATGRTSI